MAMVDMKQIHAPEDATDLLSRPDELRQRAAEDGCLFFPRLLDPARVLEVRRQVLGVCREHGWLAPGSDPADGVANPDISVFEGDDPRWIAVYDDVQRIRDFHALALDPAVIGMLEVLFGEPVLAHSRNICRLVFPDTNTHSTPPHQDNYFIGGSDETWTAWIPLGDCPVKLGGLAVNRGSHRGGMLETTEGVGPGGRQVPVEDASAWVGGNYTCGDVIILHSLTIHQGRDNMTADRLRLSSDYRYQPRSHPVREDSLQPHMNWLTWDQIYENWDEDDPVKYYWKDWDLDVVKREPRQAVREANRREWPPGPRIDLHAPGHAPHLDTPRTWTPLDMPKPIIKPARHLVRMFLPKPMAAPVDLSGRHVIVTGASPGSLGYETARILAGWGATVVATRVRDVSLMEAALKDDLRKGGADADNITAHALDLSDPHSVNAFAAWYRDRHQGKLHVLVNNAGIHRKTLAPRSEAPLTEDGFEVHWRTNYLGPFHLTWALLPLLQRTGLESGDARVVNVSSGLHDRVGNADLFDEDPLRHQPHRDRPRRDRPHRDRPHSDRPRYHSWDAYGKSKLAMNHLAFEIERRFAGSHHLHGVAVHPGVVMTNLTLPQVFEGWIGKAAHRISSALASLVLLSPNAGAQTIVMCASRHPLQGGKYYERCAVAEPSVDSLDADASKRLWEQSERWVGTFAQNAAHSASRNVNP